LHRRAKARPGWGRVRSSVFVGLWTFFIALAVTSLSAAVSIFLPTSVALLLILIIVIVGIIFDMIGLATAAATESPFHAMAAKRTTGASQAINLIRHADFVSSICNDLVGDICGTVAGAATAVIGFRLVAGGLSWDQDYLSVVMVSIVAALTVGGKAAGKGYALDRANELVFRVALVIAAWQRLRARIAGGLRRGNAVGDKREVTRRDRRVGR
jgi:CBS domain containing-hemolysin-like protein